MGKTLALGQRIELHAMDSHCADISIGLYRRDVDGVPHFLVHSYSERPGTAQRIAFLRQALVLMAGLEPAPDVVDPPGWCRFPCGALHDRAIRRAFLDLCRLESHAALTPKPLSAFDKKANANLTAVNLGDGLYEMQAEPTATNGPRRAAALARGFAKLCEMKAVAGSDTRVAFDCRTSHDALMGLLTYRAQNVRATMQEQEMATARGVVAAPGQGE